MSKTTTKPLADRMRPLNLAEFVGQQHLTEPDKPLNLAIKSATPHSMILWGPPGTGKTTLARMLTNYFAANWLSISAVLSGVKEIRSAIATAKEFQAEGEITVLFVDEVHRFNKAQQDAFLPHIEDGTMIFIGATTENPSFELNNALLSRARVYVLSALEVDDIIKVLQRALADEDKGIGCLNLQISAEQIVMIAKAADGDARRALNFLEIIADLADDRVVNDDMLQAVITGSNRRFDKGGEDFYNQISALHKSIRGTDPDAALYWLCRMLDGGVDPLYLGRRLTRIASEDIGNADPRALQLANDACLTYERLGSPEGELALAQLVLYLAVAPKSNAAYVAFNLAMADVKKYGSLEVPPHLRNAPTRLMKDLGYGENYRYAHDEPDAYAHGENYLPLSLNVSYYNPVERGLEIKIKQKLARLKESNI